MAPPRIKKGKPLGIWLFVLFTIWGVLSGLFSFLTDPAFRNLFTLFHIPIYMAWIIIIVGLFQLKEWARKGALILLVIGIVISASRTFYGLPRDNDPVYIIAKEQLVKQKLAENSELDPRKVEEEFQKMIPFYQKASFFGIAVVGVIWIIYFLGPVRRRFEKNEKSGGVAAGARL